MKKEEREREREREREKEANEDRESERKTKGTTGALESHQIHGIPRLDREPLTGYDAASLGGSVPVAVSCEPGPFCKVWSLATQGLPVKTDAELGHLCITSSEACRGTALFSHSGSWGCRSCASSGFELFNRWVINLLLKALCRYCRSQGSVTIAVTAHRPTQSLYGLYAP